MTCLILWQLIVKLLWSQLKIKAWNTDRTNSQDKCSRKLPGLATKSVWGRYTFFVLSHCDFGLLLCHNLAHHDQNNLICSYTWWYVTEETELVLQHICNTFRDLKKLPWCSHCIWNESECWDTFSIVVISHQYFCICLFNVKTYKISVSKQQFYHFTYSRLFNGSISTYGISFTFLS